MDQKIKIGVFENDCTIDGVKIVKGDRYLIKLLDDGRHVKILSKQGVKMKKKTRLTKANAIDSIQEIEMNYSPNSGSAKANLLKERLEEYIHANAEDILNSMIDCGLVDFISEE